MSGLWQLLGINYIIWPYVVWSDGFPINYTGSYKEYLALSGTRQLQGHNENFDSRIVQDAHHLGQVLPVQRLQAV